MSQDAQIAHACPHHIRYERVTIQSSRVIETASPISGQGLLSVRRDGIILPPSGLFTSPEVVFFKSGPYRVKRGTEILTVDGTEVYIPAQTYTADDLSRLLGEKLKSTHIVSTFSQSISIKGIGTQLNLEGEILKTSFGFSDVTHVARSRRITPSWRLVKISDTQRVVMFDHDIDPPGMMDISYTTEKVFCRRCSATGVENDLRLDAYGNISLVRDHDLLYQVVAKALLTERGSNPFHEWYGSRAVSMVGQKVNSAVVQSVRDAVYSSLEKIKDVQEAQSSVQTVTLKEKLYKVDNVTVGNVGGDPTSLLCTVSIRSASSEPVSVSVVFAVPGSISLDGDLA